MVHDTCSDPTADFRCSDCFGPHWWCQPCLLKSHTWQPFHRPQHWKDGYFEKVSLYDLGGVLNLGHSCLGGCGSQDGNSFGDRTMAVIHLNGVFMIYLSDSVVVWEQPLTTSSFLETVYFPLHLTDQKPLSLSSSWIIMLSTLWTSAQSFFQKLRRMTNNAFPDEVPVS